MKGFPNKGLELATCDIIYVMKKFWGLRISTLIWGFAISFYFTGQLVTASKIFAAMAIGNTLIMYLWMREKKPVKSR